VRPHLYVASFLEVPFERLSSQGYRYVLLDVDNTIATCSGTELVPGAADHLRAAREAGHVSDVCLVSNIIVRGRGGRKLARLSRFAEELGAHHVAALWHEAKPAAAPFLRAMALMGCRPEEAVVIGDQLFTDVRGGLALGLHTVLVQPLGPDHWTTALLLRRFRERRALRKAGLLG